MPARLRISATTTRARAPIAISNPLSREHSVLRTTLLGGAARRRPLQPRPRRRARRAVRVRARLPARGRARRRGRRSAAASPGERPAPAFEPHGASPASPSGPLPARGLEGRRPAGRLLRAQGRARGARRGSSACEVEVEAGGGAVPAPGPRRRGCSSAATRPAGSARSTRSSAAPGTSRRPPAFELDLAPLVAASPIGAEQLRGRDHLSRPSTRTSRSSSTRRSTAARVRAVVAEAGGELLRSIDGLRPLPRRAGRRGRQEPRAAARVPRRRPHAHRRGGRRAPRADQGGARRDRRVAA